MRQRIACSICSLHLFVFAQSVTSQRRNESPKRRSRLRCENAACTVHTGVIDSRDAANEPRRKKFSQQQNGTDHQRTRSVVRDMAVELNSCGHAVNRTWNVQTPALVDLYWWCTLWCTTQPTVIEHIPSTSVRTISAPPTLVVAPNAADWDLVGSYFFVNVEQQASSTAVVCNKKDGYIANGTCVSFCNQPKAHYLATSLESRRYVMPSAIYRVQAFDCQESLRHILASL